MGLPSFPPKPEEWKAGDPTKGELPLPRWLQFPAQVLKPKEAELIMRAMSHLSDAQEEISQEVVD